MGFGLKRLKNAALRRLRSRLARAEAPPQPIAHTSATLPGWVDEVSPFHVAGWVSDAGAPIAKQRYTVRLSDTSEVLAEGVADQFHYASLGQGIGDGTNGFYARFSRILSGDEMARVEVAAGLGDQKLERASFARDEYQPIMFIAGDIVDNCNLRCPFCLYDYSGVNATHLMSEETIEAALRFLPFVTDGNFWFSCLHEPTLHPKLVSFLEKVPQNYRRKIFYTTNLAKRMPASYYEWLANSALHHINVSIESRTPAIYERLRKGARFRIFQENWDALIAAFTAGSAPPRLRYIAMAYKSNLRELPDLVAYLLQERRAAEVELRFTFDVAHLPSDFRAAEFLDPEDWQWLREQLSSYSAEQVQLILPPGLGGAREILPRVFLAGRYECRLSWDGTLSVNRYWAVPYEGNPEDQRILTTNVRDIPDVPGFLAALATSEA